ncbi:MAG: hypothetical protein II293_05540 [Bacteroidaceae bacterium]|nr:hypothetical protein [Bacteroidaceae bacterium]
MKGVGTSGGWRNGMMGRWWKRWEYLTLNRLGEKGWRMPLNVCVGYGRVGWCNACPI